jgi:hypothetical protein
LESQIDDIKNGLKKNEANQDKDSNKNNDKSDIDSKYKNLNFYQNNIGLISLLKKENERLRKLVVTYEFKNKKYNNIYKQNKNNFMTTKFHFEIIKKKNDLSINENKLNTINNNSHIVHYSKEKKNMKIINKYYKNSFSGKSLGNIKKINNLSKMIKKHESKKIKDINMFDNDYKYVRENRLPKYNDIKLYNNAQKARISSLSQKRRKINGGNVSMNSNTMKVKNIINASVNNRIMNNNNLQRYKDLSTSQSLTKIMSKKKINNFSFNNSIKLEKKHIGVINSIKKQIYLKKNDSYRNNTVKTEENKINNNEFLEKDIYYSSSSRLNNEQMMKKSKKKKEANKDLYYQKPIINKITIFNNINNSGFNNQVRQKINVNDKSSKFIFGKKKSYNYLNTNYNNYTLGI